MKCFSISLGSLFLLALASFGHSGRRPTREPLPIEAVVRSREFGQLTAPQFSPDGKFLVYEATATPGEDRVKSPSLEKVGIPVYAKGLGLYLIDIAIGKTLNLTGGKGDNWSPSWSPDGRYLCFLSDRDGTGRPRLWVWERHSHLLREVSSVNFLSNGMQWLPHSHELVLAVYPHEKRSVTIGKLASPASTASRQQGLMPSAAPLVYRANLPASKTTSQHQGDPWSLDDYLCDLVVVDVADGRLRWVLKHQRIGEFALSPDGHSVAYSVPVRFETPGSQQILWDLRMVSLSTDKKRNLASHIRLEYDGSPFTWSPDSTKLAFSIGGPKEDTGIGDCFVVGLDGGLPRNLTAFPRWGILYKQRPPLWSADGKYVFLIHRGAIWKVSADGHPAQELARIDQHRVIELAAAGRNSLWSPDGGKTAVALTSDQQNDQSGFYQIDLATGQTKKLLEDNACFTCINADNYIYVATRKNELAYFSEDAEHDIDLWLSGAAFRHPRRVTHLNPQLDQYAMGSPRLISWLNDDGELLRGALLLPPGFEKKRRYPLIVWVYGGENQSKFADSFGFSECGFNLQLLATRGYVVLLPDAPQRVRTPMSDLAKDVLPGVNKTIEMGIADPDRLGVAGQSYGGYCTIALLVQSGRFKAAVDMDGSADLLASYGAMEEDGSAFGISVLEKGQGLMGGTPWQFRGAYIENSPFFYLNRVETPLLLIEGEKDTAVAPFLTDEIFVALRRLGTPVEYVKYEREGHSPLYWNDPDKADLWTRIISWLDQHLASKPN